MIIHSFALAHALSVIVLRALNADDSIVLTILTISMVIWLTQLFDLPIEVTAAVTLVCCFAGFYLGTKGAEIIVSDIGMSVAVVANVITTIVVTEIIGWITYLIAYRRPNAD